MRCGGKGWSSSFQKEILYTYTSRISILYIYIKKNTIFKLIQYSSFKKKIIPYSNFKLVLYFNLKKKKILRGRGGAWLHHWNWWASSAKESFPSLNSVTFIWFNVRVLVLSLQMVVAKPMALQVESFRTVTWSTIILFM